RGGGAPPHGFGHDSGLAGGLDHRWPVSPALPCNRVPSSSRSHGHFQWTPRAVPAERSSGQSRIDLLGPHRPLGRSEDLRLRTPALHLPALPRAGGAMTLASGTRLGRIVAI